MISWFGKERKNEVEITVSNRTVIRVLLLVILTFLFLLALHKVAGALTLIFVAFFLTLALNAPVQWVASHLPGKGRNSRTLATGTSFLLLVIILGGFLASIIPPLVRQTSGFINTAPQTVSNLRSENSSVGQFIRRYNLENQIDKFSEDISGKLDNIGSTAFATISWLGGSVLATLTVLVLTYMMLLEGPKWLNLVKRFVPKKNRKHFDSLLQDMYKVIKGYVNGQVLLAATAALLILAPLFLLDISYPIALMVIVFICGLIPMVGHFIGATIVTLVALFTSPWDAIIILAYYILYQQIENYIIQPNIQANTTNMSPLLVFVSVIIGVSFGGLLGGLVAIPVAGSLRVLVLDYVNSRRFLEQDESSQL